MGTTLAEAILLTEQQQQDEKKRESLALVMGMHRITYGMLHHATLRMAALLQQKIGLRVGDVAAMAMRNTLSFCATFLACVVSRGVAAPLNPKYKEQEFDFFLVDQKAKFLFLEVPYNPAALKVARALNIKVFFVKVTMGDHLQFDLHEDPNGPPIQYSNVNVRMLHLPNPEDVALLLHTSGTTSRPKGVPLTHRNLCASIANIQRTYEFESDDRSLLVMPLFHVHGLVCGFLTQLASKSLVVLPSGGSFSAETFWKDAQQFKITWYTAVPTIHQILLMRAHKDYPSHAPPPLRFIRSCSASLAPAVLERLEKTFKAPVLEAYAMTEASHQMTSNPLPKHGVRKPGCVGLGTGVEIAVLDSACNILPTKTVGEVCIRGENVTHGYLNNPQATEEAFKGGWFHTGDQGSIDSDGYLTLTGRLKELINRGGEKISPLEIDGVLLAYPGVAEAVAFGVPNDKYGEVVHAAVVLQKGVSATYSDLRSHCSQRLASFKVPETIYFSDQMPKTATGKIQRRIVAKHFAQSPSSKSTQVSAPQEKVKKGQKSAIAEEASGFDVVAQSLSSLGLEVMFGIVGIPVTQLASSAQANGMRFVGFRNEQAAGYAASSVGYLTGKPAVLLTVSGPGVVHGLAGLANATINCWPMLMLSGSVEQSLVGKGGFQELDQISVAKPLCKATFQIRNVMEVSKVLTLALHESMSGCPGGVYVDVPANVLFENVKKEAICTVHQNVKFINQDMLRKSADETKVAKVASLLLKAKKPLVIFGKGAAYSRAEKELANLIHLTGCPFLPSSMGKGLIPDSNTSNVSAVRSKVMLESDVVLVVGTRLNWQWHFGEPPRWSRNVKFVIIDVEESLPVHMKKRKGISVFILKADAKTALAQLNVELYSRNVSIDRISKWRHSLLQAKSERELKLKKQLLQRKQPMDFHTVFGVLSEVIENLAEKPIIVNEGANTMDVGRLILKMEEPRCRLDAGTHGTMGVGLGYAVAAALCNPKKAVLAIEGDSAFGFSGMECEVIKRYNLKVIVIVLNNGGIYGADRRSHTLKDRALKGLGKIGLSDEPPPTAFTADSKYELIMKAFGGKGSTVDNPAHLKREVESHIGSGDAALINVLVDPLSGAESARMHQHNFASKL